jgi:hypothetical protein
MAHDKTRSSVAVGNVNWDDPRLNDLLKKVDGWNIDNRTNQPPQEVQVRIACGWNAGEASKPALLISESDGLMVLATRLPLPHGEEVEVSSQAGVPSRIRWGTVVEERQGRRASDREQDLYLNWLRIRTR